MNTISKIAQLPTPIRDQLNRRIADHQPTADNLAWLNSLPEVQAAISADFHGFAISQQNYSDWLNGGYRDWQTRQTAREFVSDFELDDDALQDSLTGTLTQKLAHWVAIRYAATARTLTAAQSDNSNPQTELRQLREFCQDILTLRRGDLSAGRLALEQQRLALELASADKLKEEEFWEMTKRPDIQAKLYPHRDPDQIRRDVDTIITERLLGVRQPTVSSLEPDPAAYI